MPRHTLIHSLLAPVAILILLLASTAAHASLAIATFTASPSAETFNPYNYNMALAATVSGITTGGSGNVIFFDNGLTFQSIPVTYSNPNASTTVYNIYQGKHTFKAYYLDSSGASAYDVLPPQVVGTPLMTVPILPSATAVYLGDWANQSAGENNAPSNCSTGGIPTYTPTVVENNQECLEYSLYDSDTPPAYRTGMHLLYAPWKPATGQGNDWANASKSGGNYINSTYGEIYNDMTHNRIPIVSWTCGDNNDLVATVNGPDDPMIKDLADDLYVFAKTYPGFPIVVRWLWEMNNFADASTENGCMQSSTGGGTDSILTQATNYINAFQHIESTINTEIAAKNTANGTTVRSPIIWLFNPGYWAGNCANFGDTYPNNTCPKAGSGQPFTDDDPYDPVAAAFYPGPKYVDWIGIDDYNFNTTNIDFWNTPGMISNTSGTTYYPGFYPTYTNSAANPTYPSAGALLNLSQTQTNPVAQITGNYDKPLLIGETGVKNGDGTDSDQQYKILSTAITEIPEYMPQLAAYNYFNSNTANNWILDGSGTNSGTGGLYQFYQMSKTFTYACTYSNPNLSCPPQ